MIRLCRCAGWSWPWLSPYAGRNVFTWHSPINIHLMFLKDDSEKTQRRQWNSWGSMEEDRIVNLISDPCHEKRGIWSISSANSLSSWAAMWENVPSDLRSTKIQINLGPVVQSVVSLTSSLRVILLTVLVDSIYNILIFFAGKMWVAFALFQQKISANLRITQCKF